MIDALRIRQLLGHHNARLGKRMVADGFVNQGHDLIAILHVELHGGNRVVDNLVTDSASIHPSLLIWVTL